MKWMPLLWMLSMFAVSVSSADDVESPAARDQVKQAIQKLAKQGNYSWTSDRKSAGDDSSSITGKIEKDGLTYVVLKMAGHTVEGVIRGKNGALKVDETWRSTDDFSGDGGSPRSNTMTFLARHLSAFAKPPAAQALGLLKQTNDLKSERPGVYSGALSDQGVKDNVPQFGVKVSDPEGSVNFWVKDGMLVKYSYRVRAHVEFVRQQREVDYDRTTTVGIKDIGTTTLVVPDEVLKKID